LSARPGIGDQLGKHHRDRLKRLDLDLVVARGSACWTQSTPIAFSA
jgi:hypothetical protein